MAKPNHLLTFVSGANGEVFVHADGRGLAELIQTLERIKSALDRGECAHDHLMSDSWGGDELSEQTGMQDGKLVHHVKVFGWNDEWAEKHGFRKDV